MTRSFYKLTTTNQIESDRVTKPPLQAQLELYGCPEKYLYLLGENYLDIESYKIHPFKDTRIVSLKGDDKVIPISEQKKAIPLCLERIFSEKGKIYVVNSYPDVEEGFLFLWHFICNAAHLRMRNVVKYKNFTFSYVGNLRLDQDTYSVSPNHLLAYGPVLDEYGREHVMNCVEFMARFSDYNRILVASSADITELLKRIRIAPEAVAGYFSLSAAESPKKKKRKVVV